MLTQAQRNEAVSQLLEAERTAEPAARLSDCYPEFSIADAYAVQLDLVGRKQSDGDLLIGHKIGLTSRVMQQSVGIDEPDFGHLLNTMLFSTDQPVSARRFNVPRIEVELAFVLNRKLEGPGLTMIDVLAATEFVQPALEIIDSRTLTPRKVTDTIADNSACGGVVLGGRPVRPMDTDLTRVGAVLYRNGVIEESGISAAVLGHPATAIAWLANRLAQFDTVLNAGEIVLAGSFTRPVLVSSGDVFHADYGPLGAIPITFS